MIRYECGECSGWIRSEGSEGEDPYDRDNVDTSETCGGCAPDDAGEWTDLECLECGSVLLQGEVSDGGLCMGCKDYTEERDPLRADEREKPLPGGQQIRLGRGPDLTDEDLAAMAAREDRALNALIVMALRPDIDVEAVTKAAGEAAGESTRGTLKERAERFRRPPAGEPRSTGDA